MNPLREIMNPRSIAFLGASNNVLKMGTIQLLSLIDAGFLGNIYPIHPSEKHVLGLKAYPTVDELPEVPELLVIVLPTRLVPEFLEAAGRKGIRRAVIISGGFSEVGDEGELLQSRIMGVAERFGIRFVGPNCIGLLNSRIGLNTTPLTYKADPGGIGLASHSGTYICHIFPYLEYLGVGMAEAISLGNEANLDVVDALDYLGSCSHVEIICLYLEGIRRLSEFIQVSRRVALKKPIVALYVGGNEPGARAASTHTAAVSGPEPLFRGILRQAGVIQVQDTEELFDFAFVLVHQPLPRGPRIAILTNSGGPGAAMANACSRLGLLLPELSPEVQTRLREHLPHTGTCRNPVDVTFSMDMDAYYIHLPTILLEDPEIDGLLIYGVFGPDFLIEQKRKIGDRMEFQSEELLFSLGEENARQFAQRLRSFGKPVIGASFPCRSDRAVEILVAGGIPHFPVPERAVRGMAALVQYMEIRKRLSDVEGEPQSR